MPKKDWIGAPLSNEIPNSNGNTKVGSLGGASGGLFLLNPVNISLSVVLLLFFLVIIALLGCFVWSKSRKSLLLKRKLKKSRKQMLKQKTVALEKEEEEPEPKEDNNYSSASSTKSSLSACSHLTGKLFSIWNGLFAIFWWIFLKEFRSIIKFHYTYFLGDFK